MERTALGGADGDMPNARVVVVFSPTGADIAVDILKGLGAECGTVMASIGLMASIGPMIPPKSV
jgi:hypothetical protein